jgi:hypothetical protein
LCERRREEESPLVCLLLVAAVDLLLTYNTYLQVPLLYLTSRFPCFPACRLSFLSISHTYHHHRYHPLPPPPPPSRGVIGPQSLPPLLHNTCKSVPCPARMNLPSRIPSMPPYSFQRRRSPRPPTATSIRVRACVQVHSGAGTSLIICPSTDPTATLLPSLVASSYRLFIIPPGTSNSALIANSTAHVAASRSPLSTVNPA